MEIRGFPVWKIIGKSMILEVLMYSNRKKHGAKKPPTKIGLYLYTPFITVIPTSYFLNQLFPNRLGPPTVCKTTFSSRVASVIQNDIIRHWIEIVYIQIMHTSYYQCIYIYIILYVLHIYIYIYICTHTVYVCSCMWQSNKRNPGLNLWATWSWCQTELGPRHLQTFNLLHTHT